ncbi:MAG: NAD(P)H-dependent oxidoreductase subunit E [Candidatus Woesearchaeota archaeon]
MELRHLSIENISYYYLFHGVKKDNKFLKYQKYVGIEKPTNDELKKLKEDFLNNLEKHEKLNTIELLEEIQNKFGYISKENFIKLSKELDIPLIELTGIATFYKNFKFEKQGKNIIKICNGTACNVKKSPELLKHLENILKIKAGETTNDFKFSLEIVNCIGACARAPAMMVNDNIYGELTKEKIEKIIENLK